MSVDSKCDMMINNMVKIFVYREDVRLKGDDRDC